MLTEERRVLLEILARTDAIFWPGQQRFEMSQAQVRSERRRAYVEAGVVVSGCGDAAARQAFGRLLGDLEQSGLLTIARGRRREGVKLTPLGDNVTRRMAGTYTLAEGWALLELAGDLDRQAFGRPLPEHFFIGVETWQGTKEQNEALGMMRQNLVPFLPVGYISCSGDGDCPRRHWMSLTPAGRDALDAGRPDDAPESITFDEASSDEYDCAWSLATAELDAATPERPSDLVLPLPTGIGWGISLPEWFEAPTK